MSGLCRLWDLVSRLPVPCPLCFPAPQGLYVPWKQACSCFRLRYCRSPDLECVSFRSSCGWLFSLFRYHFECRLFREAAERGTVIHPTAESPWLPPLEGLRFRGSLSLPVETNTWTRFPTPGFKSQASAAWGQGRFPWRLWCRGASRGHEQCLRLVGAHPGSGCPEVLLSPAVALAGGCGSCVWTTV